MHLFQKIVISLFICFLFACTRSARVKAPIELRTEYLENPVGIDRESPRLYWKLDADHRGAAQSAYRVLVASSEDRLREGEADVWDSGRVASGQSAHVPFQGRKLESGKRYYWKVRTWDEKEEASPYSETAFWQMGLLKPDDWKARWIAMPLDTSRIEFSKDTVIAPPSVWLRRSFALSKPIRRATVYISGLGGYVLHLNGRRVGKNVFMPGWTDYNKRVQYQTYDVTDLLVQGENAAGALLGNLWWSSDLGWDGIEAYSKGPVRLLMQLEVTFADGTQQIITTDGDWKAHLSPITENTLYHGEHYDARREQEGWDRPDFQTEGWEPAEVLEDFDIELVAPISPPIQVTERRKPLEEKRMGPDTLLYDFGQNLVGRPRIRVEGARGTTVQLRFGEMLGENGRLYTANLRRAKATDRYILKGGGEEEWTPEFTFHGFQFAEVTFPDGAPASFDLEVEVIHNQNPRIGRFQSSNELLNAIQRNINWGLRGNTISVPTDCPQRDERLGWMGDAQIFAPTAAYNREMAAFYTKWMQDIRDGQEADGSVKDVAPHRLIRGPGKPGYGDAVVTIPWTVYRLYGDRRVIEENYDAMKAWVEYMRAKSEGNIYIFEINHWPRFGYGDWVAPVKSPKKPVSAAHFYLSTKLLAKMAEATGKSADAAEYEKLATDIARAFNREYFLPDSLGYVGGTQAANVIPAAFGITEEQHVDAVMERVVNDVIERDTHLSTGFIGTACLLPALSEHGYHDMAYALATQTTMPSWGHMVKKGATTIWELWNSDREGPGMNSRNHFALGSVGEWFYANLAGIRPDWQRPGFKHSRLAPGPVPGLDSVSATLETLYGTLESRWKQVENETTYGFVIPPNTTATVMLKAANWQSATLLAGGKPLWTNGAWRESPDWLIDKRRKAEAVELELPSGKYEFVVRE